MVYVRELKFVSIETAGPKHPHMFGQAGAVAWAELWERIGPLMEDVCNGMTLWKENGA